MVRSDAAVEQMVLENGEKKKTFPTTAHPNKNLYQVVAFCLNKAIEQQFALNYHCLAFCFVYMLTNLKAHRRRHLHQQCFADKCDLSTLTASNWCGILALRPDLADKFEASTRVWSADVPKVSDEDAALDESEGGSADEFFRKVK